MNRSLSTPLAITLLLLIPAVLVAWIYNGLVNKEEAVLEAWAQTESNLQRRADLVPALVETVARYLRHERQTLAEVTDARAAALEALARSADVIAERQGTVAEVLASGGTQILEDQAALERLARAESGLGRAVTGFLATVEAYPELRSADQLLQLQAQLEGTENRINVARQRFNQAVADFNAASRRLPGSLVAGLADFRRKGYFQAEDGASEMPALNLD